MEPTSTQVATIRNGMRKPPSSRSSAPRTRSFRLPIHLTFAHQIAYSAHSEEQVLQALGREFADASRGLREEVVLSLRSVLRNARDARPAPGRAFITGLLGFDDACKHFEERSYQNNELNAAYAKIEVSPPTLLHPCVYHFDAELDRY